MITQQYGTKYKVLNYVVRHLRTASYGPTVEEIRASLGLRSRASIQHHINSLLEQGLVKNIPGVRRSLRPTERGKALVELMEEAEA